jgi:two-component system, NarL family, response regulator LiaR
VTRRERSAEEPRQAAPTAIVADDDAFARRVIREVLERAGIRVVEEVNDGRRAVESARTHRPDILLMDVLMPGMDGIAATRKIVEERPEQLVVLLTHAANDDLGMMGLRAGAAGFLAKDVDLAALPRALTGALAGQAAISRSLAMRIIEQLRHFPAGGRGLRPVASPLTAREWEVLDLLCEHRSTREIAEALVLSPETVRTYVKTILRKLGVRSRSEAVAEALRLRGRPR